MEQQFVAGQSAGRGVSRRRMLKQGATAGALAVGGTTLLLVRNSESAHGQARTADASPQGAIGIAPTGVNAFATVGKIDQNGPAFSAYGYLTDIVGLDPSLLFSDPTSPARPPHTSLLRLKRN